MNTTPTGPAAPVWLADPTHGTSESDRLWTTTNIAEAVSDVLSPLCCSFWRDLCDLAARDGLWDLGLLTPAERRTGDDQNQQTNGCFYGRLALNADLIRHFLGRLPGSFADDFERDLLGMVRTDAPDTATSWRTALTAAAKTPVAIARHPATVRRLYRRQLAWWQQTAFAPDSEPYVLLDEAARRFRYAMRVHLRSRLLAQGLYSALQGLAAAAGRPDLYLPAITGLGGVTETAMSQALWDAAHGRLERQEFLHRHGFHGLHEGNLTGRSWRQEPARLDPLLAAYRRQPAERRPETQARLTQEARRQALADLAAALPARKRLLAHAATRRLGGYVRLLELSKASFVMALDTARTAASGIGRYLAGAGVLDAPQDACYLTMAEIQNGEACTDARQIVAFRRACREQHRSVQLPPVFTGMPAPLPVPRSAPAGLDTDTKEPDIGPVTGTGAGGGVAEGRIRLIDDLSDADRFQPGEILLCRTTDPSWTTLFTFAAAVVIDTGGLGSHGAIVAREFGIPCVIGTGNGTQRLRSGDAVRVDGAVGTVHRLNPSSLSNLLEQ
ncbi:PEP-utilizing enzyme [Streptomyces syringium]|uniref:PEP-utilizing enzyme n=1 Tax=Streptomyces syringium TaxID=76729 RepID=UPI0034563C1F